MTPHAGSIANESVKPARRVAVRALVETIRRTGDLNLAFSGAARPADAVRAHRRIQASRPDGYAPEVPVSLTLETDRFFLTVGGRIDGVFHGADGPVVVEEIKTTVRDPAGFASLALGPADRPLHWAQARVYAYLYARRHGLTTIDVRLTYCHLTLDRTRTVTDTARTADLAVFFDDLVRDYLVRVEKAADWIARRDTSIHNLQFPFSDYRPGQRAMAVDVYRTVRDGDQLLVQAPTGIGKTAAALFPALKAMAGGATEQVFFLTARTTGREAAASALDAMRGVGLRLKSLSLTAKDRVCPHPEIPCTPEACGYAEGFYDRLGVAMDDLLERDRMTPERVASVAGAHRVCPFELSLEASLQADCIVCDLNYAFDPRAYLRRFFLEGGGAYTFLIDEAHNLVDRSREMFSADLRKKPLPGLRRSVKAALPALHRSLGAVNAWMLDARKGCESEGGRRTTATMPEGLVPLLQTAAGDIEAWLARAADAPFRDALLEWYFEALGFLRTAEGYDEGYATVYEQRGRDLRVGLFCMDPSGRMAAALKRCRSAVFFSATLTPMAYFRTLLGCGAATRERVLPAPFPADRLGVWRADISTLYRDRERTAEAAAECLRALAMAKPGNYLFFFPSYEYMAVVHTVFARTAPEVRTLVQSSGMSDGDRSAFLAAFGESGAVSLAAFAVMGGIFGESIDLAGDRLSGAAVVGVGLPAVGPERELIRDHFEAERGEGFAYAYQYPGINRVLQAAGRVIRSETDRGVVVLIDRRFRTPSYERLLPPEWRVRKIGGPEVFKRELEAFWSGAPG